MDTANNENTFLADWLDGKLSDAALREKVSAADFEAYGQLRETLGLYQIADPDMAQQYAKIKAKRIAANNAKPVRKIRPYVYLSVAASLLLFFGFYQFFAFANHLQTGYGETTALTLADGSMVTLNAQSKVDYPSLFKYNRQLQLDGEAYFEVQKGSRFVVATALGEVAVLGTKFNVIAQDGFFEVVCFDGRVKVTHNRQSTILTKGKAVRFFKQRQEEWTQNSHREPDWITGESTFRNTPLQQVIRQFENQYHCDLQYPENLSDIRFTGSFTHRNLETALQSICIPLQLQHTQIGNRKISLAQ